MEPWMQEVIDNCKKEVQSWSPAKRKFMQDQIDMFYAERRDDGLMSLPDRDIACLFGGGY